VVERKPSTPTIEEEKEEEETELSHVYIHALGRLGHVDPIGRAQELLGHGRSEEARDLLLGLTKAGPANAPACTLLGQAHCHLSHWEEAERWCREAIRLDILALDAYYILALVLQHQGQLDEAIDAVKKVIYIDQHHTLAHFDLANLYHAKAQLPQALKSLDDALRQLDGRGLDDFIPGPFGITAGSLRETIIHQQQTWRTEAVTLSTAGRDRERLANKLRITSQEH
jgi:tetratricopeptide (TPR) repeat protein